MAQSKHENNKAIESAIAGEIPEIISRWKNLTPGQKQELGGEPAFLHEITNLLIASRYSAVTNDSDLPELPNFSNEKSK